MLPPAAFSIRAHLPILVSTTSVLRAGDDSGDSIRGRALSQLSRREREREREERRHSPLANLRKSRLRWFSWPRLSCEPTDIPSILCTGRKMKKIPRHSVWRSWNRMPELCIGRTLLIRWLSFNKLVYSMLGIPLDILYETCSSSFV